MNTALKLGAYTGGLAVAFAAAFTVGAAAGPIAAKPKPPHAAAGPTREAGMPGMNDAPSTTGHGSGHAAEPAGAALPGLAVSQDGYTLVPASATVAAGTSTPFRFTVTGPDGRPITAYRETHEKELHLIVVRRDLAGFQHVHPVRAADGTWSVPLDLADGGTYRVFADFQPAALGRALTLGTDVAVAGDYHPAALPAPAASTTVDGYAVALDGAPVAGRESELTFTVTKNGAKVSDLQPYLGAFGHLVSLRTGDLAYLHTHPAEEAHAGDRGGPQVRFATEFPTAGTYRLFLDFQVAGKVRTAAFTVPVAAEQGSVTGAPVVTPTDTASRVAGDGHGH
jgi:hypothetical protein